MPNIFRGLTVLFVTQFVSEVYGDRSSFNKGDWTFYIVSSGVCAFFASYGIGANDVANAFATSVGSKALTVRQAVVLASIFEFGGAVLMGSNVSKTIRKGIADVSCYDDNPGLLIYGMTCVTISVGIWLILASWLEMPVSTTHSCVGGIIGMTLMTRGHRCVIWNYSKNEYRNDITMGWGDFPWLDGVAEIIVSWILSPLASGICAAFLYGLCRSLILKHENAYLRTQIAFPLLIGMTIGTNTTYWIIKGTKGQSDRFGTSRLVRLAKEGNVWPTIQIGLQVGALCSFVSLLFIPYINKRINEAHEESHEKSHGESHEKSHEESHEEESRLENKTGIEYIQKQLTKDVHSNMNDETRMIHQNMIRHDPKAEKFFTYIQVFTAIVDSFSHGANDVANAMGPFSAAYIAYKKGKVVNSHEMKDTTMFWILGMGGAGMILGLTTYGYKIMNAMGVKLVSITPSRGACIELGAAFVIIYGTGQGWPLSTTHCQIGATVAVGLFEGVKGVNCKLLAKTCLGWILTLVIVGCTTAILVGPSPEPLKDEYCYGF